MGDNPMTPEQRRLDAYLEHDVGSDLAVMGMARATADGDTPAAIRAAVTRWHAEMTKLLVGMALELWALGATDDEIHKWKAATVESYFANVADAGRDAFAAMPVQGQADVRPPVTTCPFTGLNPFVP